MKLSLISFVVGDSGHNKNIKRLGIVVTSKVTSEEFIILVEIENVN